MEGAVDALPVEIHGFRSPASVWATEVVRGTMTDKRRKLFELERKLDKHMAKENRKKDNRMPRNQDDMVAVQCLDGSRKWCRGRIEHVMQLAGGPSYRVQLLDRGITVRSKPQYLCELPAQFEKFPPQAMILELDGIVPVHIAVSENYDSLRTEISSSWTTSAEKFVDDLIKKQVAAFFVESKDRPADGQTHFGQLLLQLRAGEEPIDLGEYLCESGHAKYSNKDFEKRLQAPRKKLPSGTQSSDTSSSCAPSPPCAKLRNFKNLTISEFLNMKKAKAEAGSCQSSEESTSTTTPAKNDSSPTPLREDASSKPLREHVSTTPLREDVSPTPLREDVSSKPLREDVSSKPTKEDVSPTPPTIDATPTPPKPTALSLLAKLRKIPISNSSIAPRETPSTSVSESLKEISVTPTALDNRYVPAGRSISTEKKLDTRTSFTSDTDSSHLPLINSRKREKFQNSDSESSHYSLESRKGLNSSARPLSRKANQLSSKEECTRNSLDVVPNISSAMDSSDGAVSDCSPQLGMQSKFSLLATMKAMRRARAEESKNDETSSSEWERASSGLKKSESLTSLHSSISSKSSSTRPTAQYIDDVTNEEDFLARSIMLHGGFPVTPWVTYNKLKSKFNPHIEQLLIDKRWCYSILTLEKFMWPAIQQRQNVVMISPKGTGKTASYVVPLMDFMIDAKDMPKGNGPVVLILCSGSKSAGQVREMCITFVNGLKNAPRVQYVCGLEINKISLINGCEVLVTTPPCLLRMLTEDNYRFTVNFKRLQHYVLDEADLLMSRFLDEIKQIQAKVVAEQAIRVEQDGDPIQIIAASDKWDSHLLSFSAHLRGNPLLCINDCFEACVYGKPEVQFYLTQSENKPSKLLHVLRDIVNIKRIVVFCKEEEMDKLEEFLRSDCIHYLATRPNYDKVYLERIVHQWNSSVEGQHHVLLCTDSEFDDLKIQNAACVIHYSLPEKDRAGFVKRLSSILLHLPNKFETKKSPALQPSIYLLMDETNNDQLPVVVQLMQRISPDLSEELIKAAETVSALKDKEMKRNKLFCRSLQMFGDCRRSGCPYRHSFLPEIDSCDHLPQSGVVTMEVLHVHSAAHLSVRLLEHFSVDGNRMEFPSAYTKLAVMMSSYYSKENMSNIPLFEGIEIGDMFALETIEGLFNRVQILEILEKDIHGNPSKLEVRFVDSGVQLRGVWARNLNFLPDYLKALPAQVVDVFLCGVLPADRDEDYSDHAKARVKQWVNDVKCAGDDLCFQGKVVLSITGALWLDPLNIVKKLSTTKTEIVRRNIKQSLLDGKFAIENPEHIPRLHKLLGRGVPETCVESVPKISRKKVLPKPDWAFLEADKLEGIKFICADDVSQFYVRRIQYEPLLDALIEDINKLSPDRKAEEAALLVPGDICLARYNDGIEAKWHRVQILSKDEEKDSVMVFYVDYGDTSSVSLLDIKAIPDWAVTKLPFQAIECSLAGIASISSSDQLWDLFFEFPDDALLAQVCEKNLSGKQTGGKLHVIAVIDLSDQENPRMLNREILLWDGVEKLQEQIHYLDVEFDKNLFNRGNISEGEDEGDFVADIDEYEFLDNLEFEENQDDLDDEDLILENGFVAYGWKELCNELSKADPGFVEKAKEMALQMTPNMPSPISNSYNEVDLKEIEGGKPELVVKDLSDCNRVDSKEIKSGKSELVVDDLSDWDALGEHMGRFPIPALCKARPPKTKWFEDLYFIWIKFCITGVENYFLQCTCDRIQFSTAVKGRIYHVDQQLRGTIIPDSVETCIKGFVVEVKLRKAFSGLFWERPFSQKRKYHWVSRDLEVYNGSSEESDNDVLTSVNKEIRKVPLRQRRKKLPKERSEGPLKPDVNSDSDICGSDKYCDSDEMF